MGLDQTEVIEFLSEIAHQMEVLIHERNHLKESLREKELALMEYKEKDQILKATLATASQMSDKLKQDSEREAKLIVAEAHQKVEMMTRDGRDALRKIYNDIAELKKVRMQFEVNLKALANSHLSLLEQGEKYMPSILNSTLTGNGKSAEL